MTIPQPEGTAVVHGVLYRLCWRNPITGQRGTCGPMSREQAAFLVHDEALCETSLRFWMEPMEHHAARAGAEGRPGNGTLPAA